jgi:L-fuculose-phosphate aldolase
MEAWYRLEALEHYAMILMYTGNIIGKANVLSCEQVRELIRVREKLGIRTGGIPPCCAPSATNLSDVGGVSGQAAACGTTPAGTAGNISAADIEAIVWQVVESHSHLP